VFVFRQSQIYLRHGAVNEKTDLQTMKQLSRTLLFVLFLGGLSGILLSTSLGHSGKDDDHQALDLDISMAVGLIEMIGKQLPRHLMFRDEQGVQESLERLLVRPTILLPAYYVCSSDCSIQMASLATVLGRLTGFDRDEYRILTVSFDPEEGPDAALKAKTNFLPLAGNDFPKENWMFLTGDAKNINNLLTAIGYSIQKQGTIFRHPNVLVVIAADGTIIRYLHGPRFLPFDLGMALSEAQAGTPGPSIRSVLNICFEYSNEEQKYTFQYIRIFGLLIPGLLLLFYLVFLRRGNRN